MSLSWCNSAAEPLSLLQPKESAIPPLLVSRDTSPPLGLLHPSMGMVTQDQPAGLCSTSRRFVFSMQLQNGLAQFPTVPIRPLLLWEGGSSSPARVPRPPARGCFLAAPVTDLTQSLAPFLLSWNQTSISEIGFHIQASL